MLPTGTSHAVPMAASKTNPFGGGGSVFDSPIPPTVRKKIQGGGESSSEGHTVIEIPFAFCCASTECLIIA